MKFQLHPGEKLIVNDPHASWLKMALQPMQGQLKLTNERIVFIKDAHPFAVFLLYLVKSMRSAVELEYPLGKVNGLSLMEYGKEKRLVIDPGKERPKEMITMKAEIFVKEFNRINQKQQ